MIRLFVVICGFLLSSLIAAEEFDAKVIAVMDGDTVMVLHEGRKIKIRLANIDAPESDQAFGAESRQALVDHVLKREVRVKSQAIDSYGRMIAEISIDGRSVNEAQVSKGMAWASSHFHRNKHYLELNKQAQDARRGLWSDAEHAISPEQWRKLHPKENTLQPVKKLNDNSACGKKYLCSQMHSCDEAKLYLQYCGVKSLDGNGDGIPCESLCVKETTTQR